jgi:hypothetical protein
MKTSVGIVFLFVLLLAADCVHILVQSTLKVRGRCGPCDVSVSLELVKVDGPTLNGESRLREPANALV